MTRPPRTGLAAAVALALLVAGGCGTAAGSPEPPVPSTPSADGAPSPTGSGGAAGPDRVEGAQAVPGPVGGAAPAVDPALRPVRFRVPRIGVDSSLVDLGIAADGSLEVPTDYQQAGWLDRSPPPGERGPAVIAGHVDSRSGPAVFFELEDLVAGDEVLVTRADGGEVRFAVDGVQHYAKDQFPTQAVYGPVPGPVLRLITCGGEFDSTTGHYVDNVVVYATAVPA